MKTLHELALVTKQLLEFKVDDDGTPIDPRNRKWHVSRGKIFEYDDPESFHSYEEAAEEARNRAYDNYNEDDIDEGEIFHVYHGDLNDVRTLKRVSSHNPKDYEYCDSIKDQIHIDPKTL